jgi:shikimate kinase
MHLSLIGMSGSGKSYWAKKLSEHGFRIFHCDDLIECKLSGELIQNNGTMQSVGDWMGFPFNAGYREKESKYLSFEKKVLVEVFDFLKKRNAHSNGKSVIDTTGSVVYTGDQILDRLCRLTTVVHLETPREIQEKMLAAYLTNRRPVLWEEYFTKTPDETDSDAIARCYPVLMATRERLYSRSAHVAIKYTDHGRKRFSVEKFLETVSAQLGSAS